MNAINANGLLIATGAPKSSSNEKRTFLGDLLRSFVWALRVERACNRYSAGGRLLSANVIRDLAVASDAVPAPTEH